MVVGCCSTSDGTIAKLYFVVIVGHSLCQTIIYATLALYPSHDVIGGKFYAYAHAHYRDILTLCEDIPMCRVRFLRSMHWPHELHQSRVRGWVQGIYAMPYLSYTQSEGGACVAPVVVEGTSVVIFAKNVNALDSYHWPWQILNLLAPGVAEALLYPAETSLEARWSGISWHPLLVGPFSVQSGSTWEILQPEEMGYSCSSTRL